MGSDDFYPSEAPVRRVSVEGFWIDPYPITNVANTEAWDEQRSTLHAPDWLNVKSVTDLKVKLIEVIAVLLAVLFLKGVLANPEVVWPDLVTPLAVVLFAGTIWLIRRAD